jgi:hypothetical protein
MGEKAVLADPVDELSGLFKFVVFKTKMNVAVSRP